MSNKAIDKIYLQEQFKNFNRDVVAQRYMMQLSTIPTAKGESSTYTEDQYKIYNNKLIQWTGSTTTWLTTTVNAGQFYKLTMTESKNSGESYNPKRYTFTAVTAMGAQDLTAGDGIIIDETDPNNPTISANIETLGTYNDDIIISTNTTEGDTAITVDNRSRVNDPTLMETIASEVGAQGSDWTEGDIVTYIGADYTYSGEEGDNYVPDGLVTGHQYQITEDEINSIYVWKEVAPITINTDYNANSNLAYDAKGLVDLSHIDSAGLLDLLDNSTPTPAQFADGFIFQYVDTDTTITAPDTQGGTESISIYEGRFYKVYDTGYGLSIQEIGAQKEVDYSIAETTTTTGYLKTYQLFKSVDGGAATAVSGSIIDIPKDFLVKSASVVTATTEGGFWFKNVWYELDADWDYSDHTIDVPALPTGYTTIFKYDNASGSSLYTEVDVTDLDSYTGENFWPHEIFSVTGTAWVSEGAIYKADFVEGWATSAILTQYGLTVGKKYIDFVINTKETTSGSANDEHLYLALDSLVSNYVAGAGVSITTDNVISLDFQYTTLPDPTAQGFSASKYPPAIQYIGTDDATNNNASPTALQLGGFYKFDSTSSKWVLINTAKEDVDITFNLSDFS